jgi:23S rRNA (uracil1939-C5)-methyltransferase
LVETVISAIGPVKSVADLFSGCGTFTFPLAEHAKVHAIEGEKDMISALDRGMRIATGLKTTPTEVRDLFRRPLLPDELKKFDAVVLDPPRAGAVAQSHELANSTVKRIVYVSCNPTSFARDAQILSSNGFTIEWVKPIDQFRWTDHVELVALLTRN